MQEAKLLPSWHRLCIPLPNCSLGVVSECVAFRRQCQILTPVIVLRSLKGEQTRIMDPLGRDWCLIKWPKGAQLFQVSPDTQFASAPTLDLKVLPAFRPEELSVISKCPAVVHTEKTHTSRTNPALRVSTTHPVYSEHLHSDLTPGSNHNSPRQDRVPCWHPHHLQGKNCLGS